MKKTNLNKIVLLLFVVTILCSLLISCASVESSQKTISFKVKNGDTWETVAATRSLGNEIINLPEIKHEKGKYFYGWYLDENLTQEVFANSFIETPITEDISLYAKFVESIRSAYFVTFVTNGGEEIPVKNYEFRSKVNIVPSRIGYMFEGWYLDEALTIKWDPQYDVVRDDITLYADWAIEEYKLKIDLKGGSTSHSEPLQNSYSIENTIVLPSSETMTKDGFDFVGFFVGEEEFDASKTYSGNLIIYAKWNPKKYIVTFHIPDGVTFLEELEQEFDLENGITNTKPNREGYLFMGWYYEESCQNKVNIKNPKAQNIDLYPFFTEITYRITYKNMQGVNNPNKYSYKYFDENVHLVSEGIIKNYYNFLGWFNDEELTQAYDGTSNPRKDITVYAKWTPIEYNLTYNYCGGAYTGLKPEKYNIETGIQVEDVQPEKSGYYFAGWYFDSEYNEKVDKNSREYFGHKTLYARWVDNGMLNPETFIESNENPEQIFFPSNTTKNLCIVLDNNKKIDSTNIPSSAVAIVNDFSNHNVVVITNSYLNGFETGEKILLQIIYTDATRRNIYITKLESTPHMVSAPDFAKNANLDFAITLPSGSSSSVKAVSIDNENVPFTIASNSIMIAKQFLTWLPCGDHHVRVSFTNTISTAKFMVTSSIDMPPYDVKIEIDESYPNVLVKWSYDRLPDLFSVTILDVEYKSNDPAYSHRFTFNSFDATGLLKIKDTEVVVAAYIDEIKYNSASAFMPFSLYKRSSDIERDKNLDAIFGYRNLNKGYIFYGEENNLYITSYQELSNFVLYALQFPDSPYFTKETTSDGEVYTKVTIFVDFDVQNNEDLDFIYTGEKSLSNVDYFEKLFKYTATSSTEATMYKIAREKLAPSAYTINADSVYSIYYRVLSPTSITTIRDRNSNMLSTQSPRTMVHYGNGYDPSTPLPIDSIEKTALCNNSVELYLALEHGYRPIFNSDANGVALSNMYDKMKTILREILDEDMNDYEISIAIYEYLETHVLYDNYIVSSSAPSPSSPEYINLYGYSSFFMEGVFNYGVAVCNGIAPAYASLLNMMGIKAYKVTGTTNTGEEHAWVYSCINGEWYISDPTWSNMNVANAGGGTKEMITYKHLLITKAESESQGRISTKKNNYKNQVPSDVSLNIYKNMYFTYGDRKYDHYITSQEEFTVLQNYLKSLCSVNQNIVAAIYVEDMIAFSTWNSISGVDVSYAAEGNNVTIIFTRT